MLKFECKYIDKKILSRSFFKKYQKNVNEILKKVRNNAAEGQHMMGWTHMDNLYPTQTLTQIKKKAEEWKKLNLKYIVVIGIGGSYTGVKAGIDMVKPYNYHSPKFIFIHNMSSSYMLAQLNHLKDKTYGIIVISKSGKTLEPAIAFRLFRKQLVKNIGVEKAKKLIVAITDKAKGTLHELAKASGYTMFAIPDDIGGRYSTLTPVGIFPMAVAGLDINKILSGAKQCLRDLQQPNIKQNTAYLYACLRHYMYEHKKLNIEQFNVYEPALELVARAWQQLFGESEGKKHRGLYPASSIFTTDLHSLGQYLQQGTRNFFETTLKIESPSYDIKLRINDDEDGLRYLNNKNLSDLTDKAFLGTLKAHYDAKVNNIVIYLSKSDEFHFGYFQMWLYHAAYMSAYLLKVNPFDQPGVDAYKINMFQLLGKK